MTLIDTNVLLDVVTDDPVWASWSIDRLDAASLDGPLLISDIVYAELSAGYRRFEDLDRFISEAQLVFEPMPRAALFLAGKAFARYRGAGGIRTGVLSDFLIGAQAAVPGLPLLTRDAGRYGTCFPTARLIAPA